MSELLPFVLLVLAGAVPLAWSATGWPPRVRPWLLALPAAVAFGVLVSVASTVLASDNEMVWSTAWVPTLDATLDFRADGIGLLLALLVTGIGTLIMLFAGAYMAKKRDANRLWAVLYAL